MPEIAPENVDFPENPLRGIEHLIPGTHQDALARHLAAAGVSLAQLLRSDHPHYILDSRLEAIEEKLDALNQKLDSLANALDRA